jgi:hypothetical protein
MDGGSGRGRGGRARVGMPREEGSWRRRWRWAGEGEKRRRRRRRRRRSSLDVRPSRVCVAVVVLLVVVVGPLSQRRARRWSRCGCVVQRRDLAAGSRNCSAVQLLGNAPGSALAPEIRSAASRGQAGAFYWRVAGPVSSARLLGCPQHPRHGQIAAGSTLACPAKAAFERAPGGHSRRASTPRCLALPALPALRCPTLGLSACPLPVAARPENRFSSLRSLCSTPGRRCSARTPLGCLPACAGCPWRQSAAACPLSDAARGSS